MIFRFFNLYILSRLFISCSAFDANNNEENNAAVDFSNIQNLKLREQNFKIEGKISIPKELSFYADTYWNAGARILLNYGEYQGFVKNDYTFVVHDVPPGSYVVEVANKEFIFEPFRVDLTSKGKIRCRRLNMLQPSLVVAAPYPEVQQSLQMPKCELPDMSEYLTNWVSGKKVSKTSANKAITNNRSRK